MLWIVKYILYIGVNIVYITCRFVIREECSPIVRPLESFPT